MRYDKIIKREDGTQYQITINISLDYYGINWRTDVLTREKGKRKWMSIPDTLHDYQYRSLSMEDREKHRMKNMLRFVSKQEILSVKLELWDDLKPQL